MVEISQEGVLLAREVAMVAGIRMMPVEVTEATCCDSISSPCTRAVSHDLGVANQNFLRRDTGCWALLFQATIGTQRPVVGGAPTCPRRRAQSQRPEGQSWGKILPCLLFLLKSGSFPSDFLWGRKLPDSLLIFSQLCVNQGYFCCLRQRKFSLLYILRKSPICERMAWFLSFTPIM